MIWKQKAIILSSHNCVITEKHPCQIDTDHSVHCFPQNESKTSKTGSKCDVGSR